MSSVCIEIIRADGRIQRQQLRDERTTVGSSKEASIWVQDAPELEPLHILVVPREKGVWFSSVRNARTPTLLDGKPFESGQLHLGAEVDVGSITFRIIAAQEKKNTLLRNAIIGVTAVAIAVPLLTDKRTGAMPQSSAPAPELFSDEPAECPAEGETAVKRGVRAADRARSKTLRYPFEAREGLNAVELYRLAAPCLAGSDQAAPVAAEERKLRQRIEDDYQVYRLHLERGLSEKDWRSSMTATQQLLALLADRPGEYREWLTRLQRYLDLHLTEQAEKERKDRIR